MKTKLSTAFALTLALVMIFCSTTFAAADVAGDISRANALIDHEIALAKDYANQSTKVFMDKVSTDYTLLFRGSEKLEAALSNIAQYKAEYDATLDSIGNELIALTNSISRDAIDKAKMSGAVVICEFVQVKLGDRTFLIDPLRIISD